MIEQLTTSQRKQFAIGILALCLALLFSITVVPVWSINTAGEQRIQLLQERLAGLQQLTREEETLRPRRERLKLEQINNGHYLKSNTETRAAAEVQRLVKTIAGKNKTLVTRTQILLATEDEGFIRIALKVRLRGAMAGIIGSIYDIESNEPFLFLEDLHLQDTSRRQLAKAAKQIDAEFELVAYMVTKR